MAMRGFKKLLLVIFAYSYLAACQQDSTSSGAATETRESVTVKKTTSASPELLEGLAWVEATTDPASDARKAAAAGELSFWAIYLGRAVQYPGIEKEDYRIVSGYPSRTQQGVGDTMYGGEYDRLRKLFEDYAAIYNRTLLELIRAN